LQDRTSTSRARDAIAAFISAIVRGQPGLPAHDGKNNAH
jgi:hypothetical protein